MTNRWRNNGNSERLYFPGLQNHCRWWLQPCSMPKHCILKVLFSFFFVPSYWNSLNQEVLHFVIFKVVFKCLSKVIQFSSVAQSCLTLCDPWTAACQASLSITNCRSLLKLMSIMSVMPSSHLIFCRPLLLLPPIPPSIRVFSNMATHSSILAWKIPWTEEPGGLQSIWLQRVGHDWSDSACMITGMAGTFHFYLLGASSL